jgi:hypothetical protein
MHAGYYYNGSSWVMSNWNIQNGSTVPIYYGVNYKNMFDVLKGANADVAGGVRD